ncbi:sodium transport system ATP-binding protein [Chitinivorax tropicus]|uniref:Sodium transport system ATP-binding protein n=1 Tax=Chitinivorax tropicus TaxID=714531 RepID=A0A840MRI5_9PROT|nr:ATP-binding cassette domain-containing protein [Chitinivorax tropicus]MBB5020035.1 sodium transport system ATP-binding protein [Chitinivorax tropicus]
MIEVVSIGKRFRARDGRWIRRWREVTALHEVSFTAQPGQITGLLGPNGAGKTTLLRIIAGVLQADQGQILVDGVAIQQDLLRLRSAMGVLGDAKGLYQRLTARENIRYFGQLHGVPAKLLAQRIDQLIDQLGMAGIADRPTAGFSQGERMKTAIARILVHDPRIVLLDEPTNGLDILATRSMRDVIRGLKAAGKTVLFSSHVMQEVGELCDEVVIVNRGTVAAVGSPQAILAQSGQASLEDAFVHVLGSAEGLFT